MVLDKYRLWIDLTNAALFYDKLFFNQQHIKAKYNNLPCKQPYPSEDITKILDCAKIFLQKLNHQMLINILLFIAYGLNDTGFLICAFFSVNMKEKLL